MKFGNGVPTPYGFIASANPRAQRGSGRPRPDPSTSTGRSRPTARRARSAPSRSPSVRLTAPPMGRQDQLPERSRQLLRLLDDLVDRLVGQLVHPVDLEVLAHPRGLPASSICCSAAYGIGCTMSTRRGVPSRSGRTAPRPPHRAHVQEDDPHRRLPAQLLGDELLRRRGDQRQAAADLVRRLLDEVAVEAQDLRAAPAGTGASRP